jgi:hypothetical protein
MQASPLAAAIERSLDNSLGAARLDRVLAARIKEWAETEGKSLAAAEARRRDNLNAILADWQQP